MDNACRLILVLGMHRSGTSVLTRALRTLGARLGDEHLHAHVCNPKGFFEDADLNAFNKALLKQINIVWHNPQPLDSAMLQKMATGPVGAQALTFLQTKKEGNTLLALKDPRMCRLLPFWRPVLAASRLRVNCLIALRHPESVAASLWERNHMEAEHSHALWIVHTLDALIHSEGLPRLCVDYDIMMQSPKRQISRLAHALELSPDSAELDIFLADFLDNGLQHHKTEHAVQPPKDECAAYAGRMYENLLLAATDKLDLESPRFQRSLLLKQQEARDLLVSAAKKFHA